MMVMSLNMTISLVRSMLINNLRLTSFRNYEKQFFSFDPFINIFIGDNAQGKTNVLEALSLLANGRSFKTKATAEMIMFDHDFGIVEGHVISSNKPLDMKVVVTGKGKKAFINNKDIVKLSDYIGYLNVILFLPEDLSLVQGSPRLRRRLIDSEAAKISPIYLYNISKYNKLLKERNLYLKMLHQKNKAADTYLEVLSEQMAALQTDLIKRRLSFVKRLDEISCQLYEYIAHQETLHIVYATHYKEYTKEAILEKYHRNYDRDIRYMTTSNGIQKDDLKITLDNQDATSFASQGQQRSIVLAIKIALVEIVRQEIGEYPILLLDDVLSELDDIRKTKLLNLIENKVQTFITATSIDGIHHNVIRNAKKMYIEKGKLKEDSFDE